MVRIHIKNFKASKFNTRLDRNMKAVCMLNKSNDNTKDNYREATAEERKL